MSGFTDVLKKDISFKSKSKAKPETPATEAAATATTAETEPKTAKKRSLSLPKRTPKQPKAETTAMATHATATAEEKTPKAAKKRSLSLPKPSSSSSNGRHKQLVGLSVGASQLSAAVIVNNGRPKLVKTAVHTLPPDVVAGGEVRDPEALSNEITGLLSRSAVFNMPFMSAGE